MDWGPMRPTITCPECGRRGAVQRIRGVKPFIEHRCPGPWVLASLHLDDSPRAGYRLTIYGKRPD